MIDMIEEMLDERLDAQGPVIIAGLTFDRSAIIREMDPIAYREMCCNLADTMIDDLRSELEFLKEEDVDGEHYDEIDDLEFRIRELESI
jgi:hypothetical protein